MQDGNIQQLPERFQNSLWPVNKPIVLKHYDMELAFKLYVKTLDTDKVTVKLCSIEFLPHKSEFHYFFSHKKAK